MDLTALISAAPVVDIDGTAYIQLGLFLLLMVLLNQLLYKPWLQTRERRELAINGTATAAEQLRNQADTLSAEYEERLAKVREQATTIRNESRNVVEQEKTTRISDARTRAASELEAERARLAAEATAAREALTRRVDELAQQVANKILGRGM